MSISFQSIIRKLALLSFSDACCTWTVSDHLAIQGWRSLEPSSSVPSPPPQAAQLEPRHVDSTSPFSGRVIWEDAS